MHKNDFSLYFSFFYALSYKKHELDQKLSQNWLSLKKVLYILSNDTELSLSFIVSSPYVAIAIIMGLRGE